MLRNNHLMNRIISGLLLLICFSCQKNTLYHSYQPVNPTGWHKNDTLVYTLDSTLKGNASLTYQIGIRHKDSYPYRDLWVKINEDTLHLYLTDSIGRWKGKGIGELRQLEIPFSKHMEAEDSLVEFRIIHLMKDNPLSGISDIGIAIHKHP